MPQTLRHVTSVLVALAALSAVACGPGSPEEQIAAARAQYTVRLESFTAEQPAPEVDEMAPTAVAEEAAGAAEAVAVAAEAAAEAESGESEAMAEEVPEESGPKPTDIILHLLVRFGGEEALPGITVEVTQADPFGKEKEPTLHWIETAGMTKSDVQQIDLELEGVEFEDGDAFSVLLSQHVPPEERGQYREFAEAAP